MHQAMHRRTPTLPTRQESHALPEAVFATAMIGATGQHARRLARRGAAIHLPGHRVRLPPGEAALWARVRAALEVEAGSPPALFPLAAGLGMESGALERFLARMAACGLVVAIARHRYLTPAQIERAGEAARRAARRAPQGFGVAAFRDAAGIGRNLAVDLLEYLDSAGVTRRRGDLRQLTAPDRARPPA